MYNGCRYNKIFNVKNNEMNKDELIKEIVKLITNESVQENNSCNNRVLIEQDFEIVAQELVKRFNISGVLISTDY